MPIKINEIFASMVSEGKHSGRPCIFIRLSGCTRQCDFCDTKYHIYGKIYANIAIVNMIKQKTHGFKQSKLIIWTGGEPMLQITQIKDIINKLPSNYEHHLETNGDILPPVDLFDYVCFSPKSLHTSKKIYTHIKQNYKKIEYDWDIKIVTDLEKVNVELLPYATMLMPLTFYHSTKDTKCMRMVWEYCQQNQIRFCMRQKIILWGSKGGI